MESCGNKFRRKGMDLCCKSCGDESRRRKKAYKEGCKNHNPMIDSCLENPLVSTDSYAQEPLEGSGFYPDTYAAEPSMTGPQATGVEFEGLLEDLKMLESLGELVQQPEQDIDAFMRDLNSQVNPDGSLRQ
jgi:hypothetical protein